MLVSLSLVFPTLCSCESYSFPLLFSPPKVGIRNDAI